MTAVAEVVKVPEAPEPRGSEGDRHTRDGVAVLVGDRGPQRVGEGRAHRRALADPEVAVTVWAEPARLVMAKLIVGVAPGAEATTL